MTFKSIGKIQFIAQAASGGILRQEREKCSLVVGGKLGWVVTEVGRRDAYRSRVNNGKVDEDLMNAHLKLLVRV